MNNNFEDATKLKTVCQEQNIGNPPRGDKMKINVVPGIWGGGGHNLFWRIFGRKLVLALLDVR